MRYSCIQATEYSLFCFWHTINCDTNPKELSFILFMSSPSLYPEKGKKSLSLFITSGLRLGRKTVLWCTNSRIYQIVDLSMCTCNVFVIFWCVFPFWVVGVPAEPHEEHPTSWPWPHLVTAHYFPFCGCLLHHSLHIQSSLFSLKAYFTSQFSTHPTISDPPLNPEAHGPGPSSIQAHSSLVQTCSSN